MNIANLQGEITVEALARRIYGDAVTQRPELVVRLLDANPHLENLGSLPEGTPIAVPRTGDPELDNASSAGVDARREAALADLDAALEDAAKIGTELIARREATLVESDRLARLPALREAGGADVAAQLDTVITGAAEQIRQLDDERAALANDIVAVRAAIHPPRRRVVGK
jgi:phage tail protein X